MARTFGVEGGDAGDAELGAAQGKEIDAELLHIYGDFGEGRGGIGV